MRKHGSALIIAFFLMAAVSGVAFAIARLFYLDTQASGIYENSTIAYYAAESGVEEGLLRYRISRQAEVPIGGVVESRSGIEKFIRTNLSNQELTTVEFGEPKIDSIPDAITKSIYDLRMSYRVKFYGADIDQNGLFDKDDILSSNYGQEFSIARDDSVKIDVTDAIGGDVKFMVVLSNYLVGFDKYNSFIEARIVSTMPPTGMPGETEFKKVLVTPNTNLTFSNNSSVSLNSENIGPDYFYKHNFINAIAGVNTATFIHDNDNRVYLYIRPIGCDIKVGMSLNSKETDAIASPYSTIRSTGYYGNVSRTLEAKVDRQSGTVYDLFDFVTYQHP